MMEIFDIKKYQRWEIQLFVENDGFVRLVMQISSKKAIQNIKKKGKMVLWAFFCDFSLKENTHQKRTPISFVCELWLSLDVPRQSF